MPPLKHLPLITAFLTLASISLYAKPLDIIVSIVPQKAFVEAVGGNKVSVSVLLPPGASPHSFEMTPLQMKTLAQSKLYIRIGHIAFEQANLDRIRSLNPSLVIVDSSKGIRIRQGDNLDCVPGFPVQDSHDHDHGYEKGDPHTWMSPLLAIHHVRNTTAALIKADPANRTFYEKNSRSFITRLKETDGQIHRQLTAYKGKTFLIFHPALGYFADAYGVNEISVEIDGKNPTSKQLTYLVSFARKRHIKAILVPRQTGALMARSVADSIGGKVIDVDPMAADYIENLKVISSILAKTL